ncbi:MAG: NfeD family protein [Clostridia bacterium]|nr:NfeD family protein [Clostridia bacterium]
MSTPVIVWIAMLAVFIVIEAATAQLVTIWFAVGALAALATALAHGPVALQVVVFVVVSIIALIATRPLVRKITNTKEARLNADRCIGNTAIVTETINNIDGSGMAKTDGKVWTARSADGSIIPEGAQVKVDKIEGVKLIVSLPSEITGLYSN